MNYPKEWNHLSKKERKKKIKELKKRQANRAAFVQKVRNWGIGLGVLVVLGLGIYYWSANREVLPPTDFAGHVEQNPPSHIMDEPMPIAVQKHMLEHADGEGQPGVIINYNCKDFACEQDLIEKLSGIVTQYPEFVYLAPYPHMSKKIAITKLRQREVFEDFDKEALIRFIEKK